MESEKNCKGLNEALNPYEELAAFQEEYSDFYGTMEELLKDLIDFYDGFEHLRAILDWVRAEQNGIRGV